MKFIDRLEKSTSFWFLFITSLFFFLLRLPSVFEPDWYGDEGIYQVLGIAIRNGRLLYQGIWDNKPPILYLIYALFNSDLFLVRFASLVFGLLSTLAFFFLSKKLFNKNLKISFFTTGLFGFLFAIPLIEGNIANAENFMLLPIILGGLLIMKSRKHNLLAGILLSLAFLTKIIAVFDFAAFFLFLLFINAPENLPITNLREIKIFLAREIKNLLPFIIGFLFPVLITALFFLFKGALLDFLQASFVQNVGYVGYGNKFIIPQGLLILKLLLLLGFSLFLFLKRTKFSRTFIFIALWFAFSLFNSFFSGRPYTHYVLALLPSFSLVIGLILYEKHTRKFSLAVLIISLIFIIKSFHFYVKTIYYYQNFLSFITNNESVIQYQSFFDRRTPLDYALVQFLKTHTTKDDNIFLWGNNAQVYALAGKLPPGRYAVAYHITGYRDGIKNTQAGIDKSKPKFIIDMQNNGTIPFTLVNYREKIQMENIIIYERLF